MILFSVLFSCITPPHHPFRYKNNNYFLNGYREVWLERAFKASSFDRLFSLLTVKWNCGENASSVLPPPHSPSSARLWTDLYLATDCSHTVDSDWSAPIGWSTLIWKVETQYKGLRRAQKQGQKKEKKKNLTANFISWRHDSRFKTKTFCCSFASCLMMISRFFVHFIFFFTGVQFYNTSVADLKSQGWKPNGLP